MMSTSTFESASQDSARLKVVIIGAGIAGLAAARALRQHHDVTVLERSSMKREVGAAVAIQSNAADILMKWGLDEQKLDQPRAGLSFINDAITGKNIFKAQMHGKTASFHCYRPAIHTELLRLATTTELAGPPVVVVGSAPVDSVDAAEGLVKLVDGSIMQADIVIAADGIHSDSRTTVLGHAHPDQASGHTAYRFLVAKEELVGAEGLEGVLHTGSLNMWSIDDRVVLAYSCRVNGKEYLNGGAMMRDELLEAGRAKQTEMGVPQDDLAIYEQEFSDFCPQVRDLLSMVHSTKSGVGVGVWQQRDLGPTPLPRWSRDRLILIGDAAHGSLPYLAQGAGQAIEDAEAIGHVFSQPPFVSGGKANKREIEQGLERVFLIRRTRAGFTQSRSHACSKDFVGAMRDQTAREYLAKYDGAEAYELIAEHDVPPSLTCEARCLCQLPSMFDERCT